MDAVAIADVVQVVTPPRWSVTVTTPREPEIEVAVVDATSLPNTAVAVGVLMDSAPAVSVNVMVVAAVAGGANSITLNSENIRNNEHSVFFVIRDSRPPAGTGP